MEIIRRSVNVTVLSSFGFPREGNLTSLYQPSEYGEDEESENENAIDDPRKGGSNQRETGTVPHSWAWRGGRN